MQVQQSFHPLNWPRSIPTEECPDPILKRPTRRRPRDLSFLNLVLVFHPDLLHWRILVQILVVFGGTEEVGIMWFIIMP